MPTRIGSNQIKRARQLRRGMTDGERRLWSELKWWRSRYGVHVRKQVPIGPFIADFAIHALKIVIEVDGEHHRTAEGLSRDEKRDRWFASQGFRTIRFLTGELNESFDGCIEELLRATGIVRDADESCAQAAVESLASFHHAPASELTS